MCQNNETKSFQITCLKCGASSDWYSTSSWAKRKWNTRTQGKMKNLKCEECAFFDELDTEQPCCYCFDNIHLKNRLIELINAFFMINKVLYIITDGFGYIRG